MPTPPKSARRRALLWGVPALLLTAATAALTVTRSEDTSPRPITAAEAQHLALARFSRFEASPADVEIHIPMRDMTLTVRGVVDYRSHRGVGHFTDGKTGGLVAWDGGGLAVATGLPKNAPPGGRGGSDGKAPSTKRRVLSLDDAATLPYTSWSPRAYTTDPLDTMLKLTMLLGQDRPENAQLLAQSGPRWLGSQEIDGATYGVFSAPRPATPKGKKAPIRKPGDSPLRLFVSDDGRLGRVTTQLPSQSQLGVIDFHADKVSRKVPEQPWNRQPVVGGGKQ
ncbi:hypothetical protein [Streptomyces fractus]|uniref:hypothetical protein n=1 Tax=Streptomyces fractus TaxID=641806 RepID=UPI003CFBC043